MITEMSLETTNACNLKCLICPREGYPQINTVMDDMVFGKVLDFLSLHPLKTVWICGMGEPLTDPQWIERVQHIKQIAPITTLAAISNGRLLTPEKCDVLRGSGLSYLTISFDGGTRDTYNRVRKNSDFDIVVDNIRHLRQTAPSIAVTVSFVVNRDTFHEMEEAIRLFGSIGIKNINFASMFMVSAPSQLDMRIDRSQVYGEYSILKEKYAPAGYQISLSDMLCDKTYVDCWDHSTGRIYIASNGDVAPCANLVHAIPCYNEEDGSFKSSKLCFGTLRTNSLEDLLNGDSYRQFVNTMQRSTSKPPVCANCPAYIRHGTEELNSYIEKLRNEIAELYGRLNECALSGKGAKRRKGLRKAIHGLFRRD